MNTFTYLLPQGELHLSLSDSARAVQDYFSVVARDNPRRAFLFLSKLLGKHVPVSPLRMQQTHQALAQQIKKHDSDKHSPYLFIGMAETATALAQGTYEAWLEQTPSIPSVFVSTTRYYFAHKERIEFEEGHSHAPAIGLYVPENERLRDRFLSAKTVVVIDDELSTGKTVVSLVGSLLEKGLPIERVITVALTDFSQAHDEAFRRALAPIQVERVSLLQGQWTYKQTDNQAIESSDLAKAQSEKRVMLSPAVDLMARLGTQNCLTLSDEIKQQCQTYLQDSRRILVLGCGEYMYPPYRLAHYLSSLGIEVSFCATTRSPIKVWGEIKQRHIWQDPYGEGIRNYLYNYQRANYDAVWLISELASNENLRQCAEELDARLLCFVEENKLEDGFIY